MSLVRQYGNIIINLTKVISVEQSSKSLKFVLPNSNYFQGNLLNFQDDQNYKVSFHSEEDAKQEIKSILDDLNNYHNNKKK